jgi:tryptophanyl-tRNA synthetase
LTRDIAEKFNKTFGETFKLPAPKISRETARIMSLQNPDRKMSKSDIDPLGTINILDSEEQIREKVKKAVTDSGNAIGENGGSALTNLLTIYASMKDIDLAASISENDGKSYSEFKSDLADLIVAKLNPIREKYEEIRKDEAMLDQVLSEGLAFAQEKSNKKIIEVKEKVGLI